MRAKIDAHFLSPFSWALYADNWYMVFTHSGRVGLQHLTSVQTIVCDLCNFCVASHLPIGTVWLLHYIHCFEKQGLWFQEMQDCQNSLGMQKLTLKYRKAIHHNQVSTANIHPSRTSIYFLSMNKTRTQRYCSIPFFPRWETYQATEILGSR